MRLPVPILATLAVLLPVGPIGWLVDREPPAAPQRPAATLADIADRAGCHLVEFQEHMDTNPPVTGRFTERIRAMDGSYVGKRPPSREAATHALFHGRVLFEYRSDLPRADLRALDRLARADDEKVLLFENRTGMPSPVAAAAYLSLMTCPRVDGRTLAALDAFRDRRRGFGQSF